ncbi:MAG: WD40/YVTN/BNR-like repeat-containing protein [Fibrobacterota bacterium]
MTKSVLLLFTITLGMAYAGTESQYFTRKGMLPDIRFINSRYGWAVGRPVQTGKSDSLNGSLLHSRDGGKTWERIVVPVVEPFTSVCFTNTTHGWIVTSKGSVLNTIDGGREWIIASVLEGELRCVFFTDSLNGWVCGRASAHSESVDAAHVGIIFCSTDGGYNWGKNTLPRNAGPINSLFFLDRQTGWAAGSVIRDSEKLGAVFHTEDGGSNWNIQFTTKPGILLLSIEFISEQKGWVRGYSSPGFTEDSQFFKTENGGSSWAPCSRSEASK